MIFELKRLRREKALSVVRPVILHPWPPPLMDHTITMSQAEHGMTEIRPSQR